MDQPLPTLSWVIGILVGSLIGTMVMGWMHEAGILPEPESPLFHILRDWLIALVAILPVSFLVAKFVPQGSQV